MIKAVVCDLDGTLLSADHRISDYTKKVIQKVKKKGIEVFIATGRHHKDAGTFRNILGLETYLISSNGAKVHNEHNEEIASHNIASDIAAELLDFKVEADILFNVYSNELWFANKENDMLKKFYAESDFACHVRPLNELKGMEVTKFFFVCHPTPESITQLHELEKKLRPQFEGKVDFTYSLPTCLEILKQGISKGTALKEVLDKQGILLSETMAFGDGLNDFEMLNMVGKGLVMGNAGEKLRRKLPDNEVIGINNEDGLACYLEKNLLS